MGRYGVLLVCLLLLGCGGTAPVVKVGFVAPFEGKSRPIGYDGIYAARLAVREVNAAGGIGGYRVALVAMDDSGQAELATDVARSLVVDPAVVGVVGNWLPETTMASGVVLGQAGVPFVVVGEGRLGVFDPAGLPTDFHAAYEAVTPFDEAAGEHAGATYDAFQLLFLAFQTAYEQEGVIARETVLYALMGVELEGLTGVISVR